MTSTRRPLSRRRAMAGPASLAERPPPAAGLTMAKKVSLTTSRPPAARSLLKGQAVSSGAEAHGWAPFFSVGAESSAPPKSHGPWRLSRWDTPFVSQDELKHAPTTAEQRRRGLAARGVPPG